jgi:hypothetical protein
MIMIKTLSAALPDAILRRGRAWPWVCAIVDFRGERAMAWRILRLA